LNYSFVISLDFVDFIDLNLIWISIWVNSWYFRHWLLYLNELILQVQIRLGLIVGLILSLGLRLFEILDTILLISVLSASDGFLQFIHVEKLIHLIRDLIKWLHLRHNVVRLAQVLTEITLFLDVLWSLFILLIGEELDKNLLDLWFL